MWTWADLKKHIKAGEALVEGNLEHEAILVARWLDAKRRADEVAGGGVAAAVDTAVVEPVAPVAPEPTA